MKTVEGMLVAKGVKIAIVAGRFNSFIVDKLVEGALDAFVRTGGEAANVTLVKVPGGFEIPQALRWVIDAGGVDGVVCLGCVVRGATPHFDYVAGEAAKGIAQVALSTKLPVAFGVLTTDSLEQAIERAGTKSGNKGFDATLALIEMISVRRLVSGNG